MKKILISLIFLALLIGPCQAIRWDQITLDRPLPDGTGIIFSGVAPETTTDTLYSNDGILEFNGAAIGGSGGGYVTVGSWANCTYVTDGTEDQTEVNAAIVAAGGNRKVLLIGPITISAPIVIATQNTWLDGTFMTPRSASWAGSRIFNSNATGNFITISASNICARISNLQFYNTTGVTLTAGWAVYCGATTTVTCENLYGENVFNGLYGAGFVWWRGISFVNAHGVNYELNGAWDATLDNLACDLATGVAQTSAMKGLYLHGGIGNMEASNLEIQHAGYGLYIDGCYAGDFTNCKFDNGVYSNTIYSSSTESRHLHFSNCWFTTLGTVGAAAGILVSGANVWDVTIVDFTIRDCGGHGVSIADGARNVTISNGMIYNIGTYEGSHGIVIVNGKSTTITNVNFKDGASGSMIYSIGMITASRPICMANHLNGIARYGSGTSEVWEHNIA